MSASGAIGLAIVTFVLGLIFGRLTGRSGPEVHSFGNEGSSNNFEAAQRRAMGVPTSGGPGTSAVPGPFAGSNTDFAAPGAGVTASEASGAFRVILTEPGRNLIQTIKAIREVTRLDLKDSKDLAERTPTLLARAASQAEANRIAQRFNGIAAVRVEQG